MPRYHRLGHFQDIPLVKVNQWVHRDVEKIGQCGSTGNSSGPHCHYDIPLFDILKNPREYVYGLTHDEVKRKYADPLPFIKNGCPMRAEYPLVGYHYLQGIRDPKRGIYFHSGEDLNGLNDMGKWITSPVEGRVVYVGRDNVGATKFAKGSFMRRNLEKYLNGGWGYFVIIEEKPGFILP